MIPTLFTDPWLVAAAIIATFLAILWQKGYVKVPGERILGVTATDHFAAGIALARQEAERKHAKDLADQIAATIQAGYQSPLSSATSGQSPASPASHP